MDIGWFYSLNFGLRRGGGGGGSGIGWIKTLRKLSVKVYSWALFTLVPFALYISRYVHTAGSRFMFLWGEGEVVKMDLYILSFCISIFAGRRYVGTVFASWGVDLVGINGGGEQFGGDPYLHG